MFVLHLLYDKVVFLSHCVKVEREWREYLTRSSLVKKKVATDNITSKIQL